MLFSIVIQYFLNLPGKNTQFSTPDDDGEGSLREALLCAEPRAVVTIGSDIAGDMLFLTSRPLVIDREIALVRDPNDNIYIWGEGVADIT